VLETLLRKLTLSLDGAITICANGNTDMLESHVLAGAVRPDTIRYYRDNMPRGTGGCIKAVAQAGGARTVFVSGGANWIEEDPQCMLAEHRAAGNALTVFCAERDPGGDRHGLAPTGLYCVEPEVLPHIRDVGFQDLKEQVIPALKAAGLRVGAVVLRRPAFEITNWSDYLRAVSRALATEAATLPGYRELAPGIWAGERVSIAPDARIVGPALIGHDTTVKSQALVVGPAVLGRACRIEPQAWAIRMVTADRTVISAGVHLTDTLSAAVMPLTTVPGDSSSDTKEAAGIAARPGRRDRLGRVRGYVADFWLPASALCAVFIWAFWSTAGNLWQVWQNNPDYSAGQLVPLAALYMMASRREAIRKLRFRFWSGGLLAFALGVGVHLFGGLYMYGSLENAGMVLCAVGILMSILGREASVKLWYPLAFLFLMLPLPHRVHLSVLLPLQDLSTRVSGTVLEMLAIPVVQRGHVLEVAGHRLAVAEACSGLRMALAFLIVTAVVVYLMRRPRWQKGIVLLSAVPIAIVCNVVRIVGSAFLYNAGFDALAQGAFHDGAGIMMMPVALLLIYVEFRVLENLVVPAGAMALFVERVDRRRVVSKS